MDEPVAIKQLKALEAEVWGDATGAENMSAESRRLTFEGFRHEVWIMR